MEVIKKKYDDILEKANLEFSKRREKPILFTFSITEENLGKYNPDSGGFDAKLFGENVLIKIDRDKAI